jgi:broad specificity phosphatase PhoE
MSCNLHSYIFSVHYYARYFAFALLGSLASAVVALGSLGIPYPSLLLLGTFAAFAPKGVVRKLFLIMWGASRREQDMQLPVAPPTRPSTDEATKTKTIILIRHGESEWNARVTSLEKKKSAAEAAKLFLRWLWAEGALLLSKRSVLLDPPLTSAGLQDAVSLGHFVGEAVKSFPQPEWLTGGVAVCCSSLRRAAATALVGLSPLLKANEGLKVHVLSALQEASDCPDTVVLAPKGEAPDVSWNDPDEESALVKRLDPSGHNGQVSATAPGPEQFEAFLAWAFERSEANVIAVGHSGHFRAFFQTYVPYTGAEPRFIDSLGRFPKPADGNLAGWLQHRRIPPGSAVLLSMCRQELPSNGNCQRYTYRADAESLRFLHGGDRFIASCESGVPWQK